MLSPFLMAPARIAATPDFLNPASVRASLSLSPSPKLSAVMSAQMSSRAAPPTALTHISALRSHHEAG